MEFVQHDPAKAGVPLGQFVPPKPADYTTWDVVASAFLQENELVNALNFATRPTFNYDSGFDSLSQLAKDPLGNEYGDKLARAQSQAEYNYIRGRILSEQRQKEILASSGFGGFAASAVAGVLSPTSLVPLMGPARGIKGVAQAFALAAGAVTAQEAALYGLQEIRSGEEVALGVAAGTVLGGLLGSAARHLTPDARARLEVDMVDTRDQTTILRTREDGAIEELRIEPEEAAPIEPTPVEFERKLVRRTVETADEEMRYGKRPLEAELPEGYTVRFVKQPAGGGGAYFTGGEYEMVIRRPDGTEVSAPQPDPRSPNAKLAGNTFIEKQKELIEAFTAGKLDAQIDDILKAAGDGPITTRAGGDSVGAARADEAVGGIQRANTYVGRVVNRGTDWLQRQTDRIAPEGEGLAAQVGRFGVKAVPNTLSAIADPIGMLAKLNPVTRQLENRLFPSSQKWAARMQVPGVKLEGGYAGAGDMYSRSQVHMKHVVDFIRAYDKAFADYVTDGRGGTKAGITRASTYKATGTAPEGKMTYPEFAEEVFRLGNTGGEHSDAGVNAAVAAQRKYYDEVNKIAENYYNDLKARYGDDARRMYEELEFGEDSDIQHYVHHIFNTNDVEKNTAEFIKDFSEHGEELLKSAFRKSYEGFAKKQRERQALHDILGMDEGAITSYAEQVRAQRDEIDLTYEAEMKQIRNLRKSMKDAERSEIEAVVQETETSFGAEYAEAMKLRRQLMKELSVLNKAGAGLSEEQARLVEQLGKVEEMQMKELDRFADAAARFKKRVARIGEAEARNDAEVQRLAEQILKHAKGVQKQRNAIDKAKTPYDVLVRAAEQDTRIQRMQEVVKKLDAKKALDFDEARQAVDDALEGARRKAKELNSKRTLREERLKERIEEADPDARATWREAERTRVAEEIAQAEDEFDARWRGRGATGNPARGDADFAEQALADAQELYKRIVGSPLKVSGAEVIGAERGAQLQRMLNLPFEKKAKYLMRDPEKVIRAHGHSMFPDLELYRETGSVNGAPIKNELDADYAREQARVLALPEAEQGPAMKQLEAARKQAEQDWDALITRFRHQRGVPRDADSIGYRLGRVAMNLNVTRFMGTVVLSSLPDLARPVFRYGLTGTFREAWMPMLNDMARVKAVRAEAERAGIALDPITHNRSAAIYDVGENYANKQTLAERGLEFLSNKTGFIALFDRWTAEMKHMATNATFAEISHALRMFNEATPGSKEFAQAEEILRHISIDRSMAQRIWRQYMRDGGSSEFKNGFRLPNTEDWDDFEAVMALRAGVNRVVNDLIVTPALDRPSWMDENMAFKLVAQFRSFTFTSTNRILMSGLQEADMAYLQGVMFSVALGAMSYYTWAVAAGGRAYEEAMQLDQDQWIYEAISRSGMLGVLSEGQRIGEQIPGLSQLAIFGAEQDRTQRATSVLGAVLGPSYDLAERLAQVVQGIDDPTQSTLHAARKAMVPYQNVFYLRRLLDAVEEGVAIIAGLPERRGQ